jgi:hypothetical protein
MAKDESTNYDSKFGNDLHYIIMSQKDIIKNQVLEEILRERASHYNSKQLEQDFWLVTNPSKLFENKTYSKITKTKFYNQQFSKIRYESQIGEFNQDFLGAIISTNIQFIEWLRLRIGYFEDSNALPDNSKASYVSDGVFGTVNSTYYFRNLRKDNFTYLHPDLVREKSIISLEIYYRMYKDKQNISFLPE